MDNCELADEVLGPLVELPSDVSVLPDAELNTVLPLTLDDAARDAVDDPKPDKMFDGHLRIAESMDPSVTRGTAIVSDDGAGPIAESASKTILLPLASSLTEEAVFSAGEAVTSARTASKAKARRRLL